MTTTPTEPEEAATRWVDEHVAAVIAGLFPLWAYLDADGAITADSIRQLIADACPPMAEALESACISVWVPDPDLTADVQRRQRRGAS